MQMSKAEESVAYLLSLPNTEQKETLLRTLKAECGLVIKDPKKAPVYMKKEYNRIVMCSDLFYEQRQNAKIQL